MPKKIRLFTGTNGLNTKIDPVRIEYNSKTGVQDLAACKNIDIENSGRISRRKGFTSQLSLSGCHSLFCQGKDCLFVSDDALCVLDSDYSHAEIRNVTPGAAMRYRQVDGVIYYCNGFERGKVFEGVSYGWNKSTYYGPTTTKVFMNPPIGTDLEYYAGRMFIVQGKIVPYSELYDVSTFERKSYLPFDAEVVMFKSVESGIFASTDKETFFLAGNDANAFSPSMVADYPAIKGTEVKIVGRSAQSRDGGHTIATKGGNPSLIWLSREGVCFGGSDGSFLNLTEEKVVLPDALTGSGFVYDDKYIGIMNP